MTAPSLSWIGTGLSHTGMVRSENQDAFGVDNQTGLWVVADGMGGHVGGQVASRLAVDTILDHLRKHGDGNDRRGGQACMALLVEAIAAGCQAIVQRVAQSPELARMGTTVVGGLLCVTPHPALVVAHVGDSRGYLIRDGSMQVLTVDHSLVQQLVVAGHISREQARTHPQQNVLLKALGQGYESVPDVHVIPLAPRDMILLCTDGLTKMVSEEEILSIIRASEASPEHLCRQLIERANLGGGTDNVTALIVIPQDNERAP